MVKAIGRTRSRKIPGLNKLPKMMFWMALDRAARDTSKRGYHKGSHSFEILAKLDAEKVKNASPHAKRFIESLLTLAQS